MLFLYQHLANVSTHKPIFILSHLLISPFLRWNSVPKQWSLSNRHQMVSVAKENWWQQVKECKACLELLSCFAQEPVNHSTFLYLCQHFRLFNEIVVVSQYYQFSPAQTIWKMKYPLLSWLPASSQPAGHKDI